LNQEKRTRHRNKQSKELKASKNGYLVDCIKDFKRGFKQAPVREAAAKKIFPSRERREFENKMNKARTNLSKLVAAASWSEPVPWRFGRREMAGQKSGPEATGPQSKTRRGFGR
jgi:hypothetical protein